ncbi:MAG: DUF4268 domain-containing protein [Lacunisphaera sp.]
MTNIGRLQRVGLREAWPKEDRNFTPWLAKAENMDLLGETIDLRLECVAQEKVVGPFRADLVCKDTTTDHWVLIENQLEPTDHSHLGQLLTYAAGLEAVTIVWIAERFIDEHRAALDWLNEHTVEGINFFGLEVELWRIGDSPLAPKFNIVCKPNEWTRSVIKSRENSDSKQFCLDYWSGVLNALRPSGILSGGAKPFGRHDTMIDVGWRNFLLKAYFSRPQKRGGVWVTCRGPQGLENYVRLNASKAQIEQHVGRELEWNAHEQENHGSCLLPLVNFDVDEEKDWPRQHQLFAEAITALYRAVAPFVADLDVTVESKDN